MDINSQTEICHNYDLEPRRYQSELYGSGLVNTTYLFKDIKGQMDYILQKINTSVFKNPDDIAFNQTLVHDYLKKKDPEYYFLNFFITINDKDVYYDKKGNAWRLLPFIKNSVSYDFLGTARQAYSASQQFARLTNLLDGIDVSQFKIIIPGFHNLAWRYKQFTEALQNANAERLQNANETIQYFLDKKYLVTEFNEITANKNVVQRITHNDTKISNVLFDKRTNEAICVIDLDTLMPGLFIYDLGDMIRTFTSPVNEDEPDVKKVFVREEIFESIISGYLSEMKPMLSDDEKNLIYYSGQMMIYIMGLRFITDYLNNDIYYKTLRLNHNLDRANNQRFLLTDYENKKATLEAIIQKYI